MTSSLTSGPGIPGARWGVREVSGSQVPSLRARTGTCHHSPLSSSSFQEVVPSAMRGVGVEGTGPCSGGTGFPSGPVAGTKPPAPPLAPGFHTEGCVSPGLPVGRFLMSGGLVAVGTPPATFSAAVWTSPTRESRRPLVRSMSDSSSFIAGDSLLPGMPRGG